jgi:hypothetical protein
MGGTSAMLYCQDVGLVESNQSVVANVVLLALDAGVQTIAGIQVWYFMVPWVLYGTARPLQWAYRWLGKQCLILPVCVCVCVCQ